MCLEPFHKIEMDGKLADSFYETKNLISKLYNWSLILYANLPNVDAYKISQ